MSTSSTTSERKKRSSKKVEIEETPISRDKALCPPTTEQLTQRERRNLSRIIKIRDNELPECRIKSIKYRLFNEDISKIAVVEVTSQTNSKNTHGTPTDPKMGVMDHNTVCETCQKSSLTCPGHYGISSTGTQLWNYLCFDDIPKLLKCVCWNPDCSGGGSLIPPENLSSMPEINKLRGKARLEALYKLLERTNCSRCGRISPTVTKDSSFPPIYKASYGKEVEWILSPTEAYAVLDRIKEPDAKFLGFSTELGSHPRDFVVSQILMIPICARPPAFVNGVMNHDDITLKYNDLTAKIGSSLNNSIARDTNSSEIYKIWSEIIDNKQKSTKQHSKEPIPSIKKRIDGKKGYVRNAMMGKRKDYTSRSVIVTASSLRFGEIGVPYDIASEMPYSIRVTRYNIDYIHSLFGNSYSENKVKTVIPLYGPDKDIDFEIKETNWERFKNKVCVGWVVQRAVQTGDYIFGGRQPTIGASSLMGFRAVVMPGKVFRLNMCYTTPFNADYDGDEMHFHYPQSVASQTEARTIVNCVNRLLDPNSNGPNFGIVYNGLTSGYLLTLGKSGFPFTEKKWMEGYEISGKRFGERDSPEFKDFERRLRKYNIPLFSGKALFSTLFDRDFYYDRYDASKNKGLLIKDGILVEGVVVKAYNGRARRSILQSLYSQYSRDVCVEYLTRCVWLLDWFISYRGFTIALEHCNISDEQYAELRRIIKSELIVANQKTKELLKKNTLLDEITEKVSFFENEFRESQLQELVKKISEEASALFFENKGQEFLTKDNPLYQMWKSGAKGDQRNISQIMAIVGQQLIYGRRPEKTLTDGKRCSPYFAINDDSPLARGFCQHSFLEGLDPSESYWNALAARIGMLETGINTSVTGSMQRRCVKVGESQLTSNQGGIINTSGSIFGLSLLDNFEPKKQLTVFSNPDDKSGLCSFIDFKEVCGKLNQQIEE